MPKRRSVRSRKPLRVLVTAGPTREFFDPVRFLSNPSSGRMGYALAEEAAQRGHKVTLISGPVSLPRPESTRYLLVVSAEEMHRAVMREAPKADIVIMAAAVSDWRPATFSLKKLKKKGAGLQVTLLPTRDILKELGRLKRPGQILVGFAAETDHLMENAQRKMTLKNLDMIVVNRVGISGTGFESGQNQSTILMRHKKELRLPLMRKVSLARRILNLAFIINP